MLTKLSLPLATLLFCSAALADGDRYILGVKGLACPFCAYGIEKRLNKVDGVTAVQVDVGDGLVRVTLEEGKTFTEEQARQAVREAGFTLGSFSRANDDAQGPRHEP